MYELKQRRLRSQIVITGIEIHDIGNFENLLRLVLIDEECGILKNLLMVENLLETLTKRKSQTFYEPSDLHSCDKCCRRGHYFNKEVDYCESVSRSSKCRDCIGIVPMRRAIRLDRESPMILHFNKKLGCKSVKWFLSNAMAFMLYIITEEDSNSKFIMASASK